MPTNSRPLPKPWFGLDTERDSLTGEFVCGWAVGDTIQQFKLFTDLVPGTYWIWNLGYDAEGMIRDLNIPEGWAARADGAHFPLLDGMAVYYHGKRFDYKTADSTWQFIEASSFFGRQRLSKMGSKGAVDASRMSLGRYETEAAYRDEVNLYCQQDARIVFDRINEIAYGVDKLGITLGATPGATARRFLAKLGPFPKLLWQTHRPFLRSYCGGRFEVCKRGVCHDCNQYDIVSAYPWALSKCPWLTDSAYSRQTRRFSDNALYGTYCVKFDHDSYLGVAPRWRNGVRVYSKREDKTWLARPEVEYLLRQGARFEILHGVEIFDPGALDLWRTAIEELFALKTATKTAPDKGWGAKIILNSQYGILIQLIRKTGKWVPMAQAIKPIDFAGTLALEEPPKGFDSGKYYAPVYAGHLTALTRVRILEAASKIGPERYIGGHTDSVLCMGKLPMNLGTGLGDWVFGLEHSSNLSNIYKPTGATHFWGETQK